MTRLSEVEIEARMRGYEEAADHLTMNVCDTDVERKQFAVVEKQIRDMALKWYNKIRSRRNAREAREQMSVLHPQSDDRET